MDLYDFELVVPLDLASAGKSSLLIPDRQLEYFQENCTLHGSKAAYFNWMVSTYLRYLPRLQNRLHACRIPNWNTTYQPRGQSLIKKNFVPNSKDWELFRNAALACGVSMCFLFVFLMRQEAEGIFKKLQKKPSLGRNSSPTELEKPKKFKKFSKILRILDEGGRKLVRRHAMR